MTSFFQSSYGQLFFTEAMGSRVLSIQAADGCSSILVQLSGGRGVSRFLTTKAVIWHGPAGEPSPAIFDEMLAMLHKALPWYTLFVQFRMAEEIPELEVPFRSHGYRRADRLNLLMSVSDTQTAWDQMSPSRRREVRRSQQGGMTTSSRPTEDQVSAFYDLLKCRYRQKIRKPLPGLSFFRKFNTMTTKGILPGCFIVCLWQGKVVGGIVCPMTPEDTLYELYVTGLDQELSKNHLYPSVMATWAAIAEAGRMGCHTFDFMGMGVPGKPYGVRDFKARFGGRWINPGRWNKIFNPFLYHFTELLYNLYYWIMTPLR